MQILFSVIPFCKFCVFLCHSILKIILKMTKPNKIFMLFNVFMYQILLFFMLFGVIYDG